MVHHSAVAWTMRGEEYILPAEAEQAIACFLKAIEIDPDYPPAWNRMGNVCIALGHEEEADLCFAHERAALEKLGLPIQPGIS